MSDGATVVSERGTADLLGIDKKLLSKMRKDWPPKIIKPFIMKSSFVTYRSIKVTAKNSSQKGKNIVVYDIGFI
ncbi:MAG TPA: hypothetical protein ENK59_07870 [Thioploca sp.]|nr:hypothetical protein [Thioploca sp.]